MLLNYLVIFSLRTKKVKYFSVLSLEDGKKTYVWEKGVPSTKSKTFISLMQMQTMQKFKYTYLYNPLNLNATSFFPGLRQN